jgi:hypothetical protein
MQRLLLSILLGWIVVPLYAQFYITGQEPFNISWREHSAEFGKIIFPSSIDSIARVFSNYIYFAWDNLPDGLGHKPHPFPIIIHPHSILSNGFVSWAPKRMEIVSQPDLGPSPEPWLKTIALHETQHIIQVGKLNDGIFRLGSNILGEQAIGPAVAMVPLWYLEGDAVYAETAYSKGGRGRQASFYQHYRTHILKNGKSQFSYEKWLMGSYKDFIPNHYQFGYLMVGLGYLKYNHTIWSKSLEWVYKKPYSIFPFYFSIKKITGFSRKEYFNELVNFLDSTWNHTSTPNDFILSSRIVKSKNIYTEYNFPFLQNDSTLIALKSSLTNAPAFVSINTKSNKERILHCPGYITEKVSFSNGSLYWSEYRPHNRWEYLNYSEIWKLNLATNRANRITHDTRMFNPVALSNGTILAIEYDTNGSSRIIALSPFGARVATTNLTSTIEPKEIALGIGNEFFVRASSPNGTLILRYASIQTIPDTILGPVFYDISNIYVFKDQILFTMSHNFKEEIFAFDPSCGSINMISNSKNGSTQPSIYKNEGILACEWEEKGLYPVSFIPESNPFELHSENAPLGLFNEGGIAQQTPKNFQSLDTIFVSKKHSTLTNLLHIHSWAPFYYNPFAVMEGTYDVYPGATIISQNLTGSLAANFGYSYNQTHGAHAYIHWMGWYPIISLGIEGGNIYPEIIKGPLAGMPENRPNDNNFNSNIQVRFPVRLTSNSYFTQINSGVVYSYSNAWFWNNKRNIYEEGLDLMQLYFSLYRLKRMAHRDLRPKVGFYLYSGILGSPLLSHLIGKTFFVRGRVYLPGVWSNHSLMISSQLESEWEDGYIRPKQSTFPRGYSPMAFVRMISSSLDYCLPIVYPDYPLGSFVYFKRFFANFFFDRAYLKGYSNSSSSVIENFTLSSAGLEIYSDMNFFRTRYEISLGYRAGILFAKKERFHELVLTINPSSVFGQVSKNGIVLLK